MAKKWMGDGDFFCWHCGRRIEKGKRKCPQCGAHYSGTGKRKYPPPKRIYPEISFRDRSFRAYRWRGFWAFVVWAGGFSLLLPLIIKLGGDGGGGSISWEEVFSVVPYVLLILWSFWIIWIIRRLKGFGKRKKMALERNNSTDGDVVCAICGCMCDRDDNYCGRCGCLLLKDRRPAQTPEPEPEESPQPERCRHCGQELRAGVRFCENCGTAVEAPKPEKRAAKAQPTPEKQHWEGFANVPQEEENGGVMDALKDAKVSARLEVRTPFGSGAKGVKRTLLAAAVVILVLLVLKAVNG